MKTALAKLDVGLQPDSSVYFIRDRVSTGTERGGFIAPHLECIVLTRREGNRENFARVLLLSDMNEEIQAGPDAETVTGETFFNLRREATEEFGVGEGRVKVTDLSVGLRSQPGSFSFQVSTTRPLIIVGGDTYRRVLDGARKNNGRNFCVPPLVDLFRGLRSEGPSGQLWQVGLGQAVEHTDLRENVWATRLEGRPHIGYRSSPTRDDRTVARRKA